MVKTLRSIALVLLLLLLCGCAPVSVSELYSLPQLPDEYLSLQGLIDAETGSGSEYCSPVRGSNRQSVQQVDLDGSGQFEALAFFRTAEGALKICIYQFRDGSYVPVCTIAGEGSSIGRVEYADMDSDGTTELIVAWQMDGGITMLNVYDLRAWSGSVLLTADCGGFTLCPLAESGVQLLALHYGADGQGFVDMYTLSSDSEMVLSSAQLSRGFDSAVRMTTGRLSTGEQALFVEGTYMDSRTITDVLTVSGDELRNISVDQTGISQTTRSYPVYSEDINGDGVTEIPATRLLPIIGDSNTAYQAIDWYQLSMSGRTKRVLSTFHCYDDGWYLELDALEISGIAVQRESSISGRRIVIYSAADDELSPLLSVYTFTGENRHERARLGSRVILAEDGTTVYAMQLHADTLDPELVAGAFHLIRTEWISPVL